MKLVILLLLALTALLLCPILGTVPIPLDSWWADSSSLEAKIFWGIRVPRVFGAFLVGAGLATSGMVFQSMFRNILATPFTLGVSSGAAFGATLFFALGFSFGFWEISGSSLFGVAGALATTFLLFLLASRPREGSDASVTLLLSGVVISFFFSSLILLLQYLSDFTGIFRITRWLMGSLEMMSYRVVSVLSLPVLIGGAAAWFYGRELNLLTAGDELAMSRGVPVRAVRGVLVFLISFTVGSIVSFCGPIGFVGIIVPHICRQLVGVNHRILSVAVFLFGGMFLVLSDTLARLIVAPYEIPVGVITSLLGGPFFLWLLLRATRARG